MIKRIFLLTGLAMSAAASAQTPAARPAPPAPAVAPVPPAWPLASVGDDTLSFMSAGIARGQIVKDAPYTATAVSETRQTLADGNRISRSTSMQLARDREGRTRQEQVNGTVFINDPVAGKRYVVNLQRKTGRELPLVPRAPAAAAGDIGVNADEIRARAEELRHWAQEFSARLRSEIASTAQVRVEKRRSQEGDKLIEHVEIVRLDGSPGVPPMPPMPPMPPALPAPGLSGPGVTTSLGSRDVGGVRADGSRTTWTIAAGRIGNDKPIEIVAERWYAPDLMLVVESRHADPRSGERIYRLENLQRGEPPAELFRIPHDVDVRAPVAPRPAK